jgi:hypothetical protein
VEQSLECTSLLVSLQMHANSSCDRDVAYHNACPFRRFPPKGLWQVSQCEINRISFLRSIEGQMCLVSGDNYWGQCMARRQLILQNGKHSMTTFGFQILTKLTWTAYHQSPVHISEYIRQFRVALEKTLFGAYTKCSTWAGFSHRLRMASIGSRK